MCIRDSTHIYSALARGLSIDGYNPTSFYEVLDGQWWYIDRNLDLEATKASAQALVIDSIKQGVTTIFDHHASFCEVPGSLMRIAEVTREFGMRACLCYDVYDSLQNYGRRPVQRLQDHGILGPKTILGHCIHVNTAEMDIIKATDTMCVNNPESNMGNAVGISPVLQLYKKGILIGLGTDAYTNDMLESIKVALGSQRHNACMPNVGWCEVTDMLFRNNAKMAERTGFPTLGVLKPGAAADVIVMDYKPFTPFSDANIDGHMLFGMTGRQCQTTMINGRILMKDRVLTEIDEEAVNAHILESSKRLWGRLNHKEY